MNKQAKQSILLAVVLGTTLSSTALAAPANLTHSDTVAPGGITVTSNDGQYAQPDTYTYNTKLEIQGNEVGQLNLPESTVNISQGFSVAEGGKLSETAKKIIIGAQSTTNGETTLTADDIEVTAGLTATGYKGELHLYGGIAKDTKGAKAELKATDGGTLFINGKPGGASINADIIVADANDQHDGANAVLNNHGVDVKGDIIVNNKAQAQAFVDIQGGTWEGFAKVANATNGSINITVGNGGKWIGKTDNQSAPNSVNLTLENGTFINTDNSVNAKIGTLAGKGRVEIAQIVPVGAALPDATTLEVKNLDADGQINFVGRSSYGHAAGKQDKLSVLNVEKYVGDKFAAVDTPSNSTLTIVAPLETVYKQYNVEKKANQFTSVFSYDATANNPLFKASNVALAEEGFTAPVFAIQKDTHGNKTYNVMITGKQDSAVFKAIAANAVGVYDRGIASRTLLDRALHRNELIAKQDGAWARYQNVQTGVDKKFATVGNGIQLGYNKVFGNYQNGATLELSRDKFEYKDEFAGTGKFRSMMIGAYHTQFLPDEAYLDYSAKFGKIKSDVTVESMNAYKNKYSVDEAVVAVEYGKKIAINDKASYTPQVQLQYAHMGDADFTNAIGKVKLSGINSLIARTGVDVNYKLSDKLQLMSSFNVMHEFAGKQTLSAVGQSTEDSTSTTINNQGTWYGVGLGVNWTSDKLNAYANVDKLFGHDKDKDVQVNVGVKYAF